MLEQWDQGESVWSIEMGGLGPGYEQAIQVVMFEILRVWLPFGAFSIMDQKKYHDSADVVVREIDDSTGGLSGAQVGAAKSLAGTFLSHQTCVEEVTRDPALKDRVIQVSAFWPRLPDWQGKS